MPVGFAVASGLEQILATVERKMEEQLTRLGERVGDGCGGCGVPRSDGQLGSVGTEAG